MASVYPETSGQNADKAWEKLQSKAIYDFDDQGRPVLRMQVGDSLVQIGASADNVLSGSASPQLVRQLLEARLQSELRHKSVLGVSETEIDRDWKLLQQTMPQQSSMADSDSRLAAHSTQRIENIRGNRP
jgi:hypothetical protein